MNSLRNSKKASAVGQASKMGLMEIPEIDAYYAKLTNEERRRMQPCKRARCVMTSGDSPPPLQASLPTAGFDMPDDVRIGKITPSPITAKSLNNVNSDAEAIEEAVPIVMKTYPMPEPQPKIERNGIDFDATNNQKKPVEQGNDDSCIVNCIYFTQQCCECTIV